MDEITHCLSQIIVFFVPQARNSAIYIDCHYRASWTLIASNCLHLYCILDISCNTSAAPLQFRWIYHVDGQ